MKKYFLLAFSVFALLFPWINHAADVTKLDKSSTLSNVITLILGYFTQAIYVIISLCVLVFVYGVGKYFFWGSDKSDSHKEGAKFVGGALFGLFVILSLWGLVAILRNTFFSSATNDGPVSLPQNLIYGTNKNTGSGDLKGTN
ncbi:MAG: hypothetical protein NTV72_03885 [Candidatus Taylorbacteria bacterium]|nr:hypothetical protein [Candidatus Taylorbacteria bacterium]